MSKIQRKGVTSVVLGALRAGASRKTCNGVSEYRRKTIGRGDTGNERLVFFTFYFYFISYLY